jgi:hypothetical protein
MAAPAGAGARPVVAHAASSEEHNSIKSTRRTQSQFITGNGRRIGGAGCVA